MLPVNCRTALVVDDEPDIRWALRQLLEAGGFTVNTASSGSEALENILSSPQCDIVLVDAKLPDIDGVDLARRIRSDTDCKAPLILVSGYFLPGDEAVVQAINSKLFAAFISKPFSHDVLMDRIQKMLRSN